MSPTSKAPVRPIVIVLILLVGMRLPCRAQTNSEIQDAAQLRDAAPEIRARMKRIREEIASPSESAPPATDWARDWAGEYYLGDGVGMNVRFCVSPAAGVAYTWHGCLGLYQGNHGTVAEAFDEDNDGRPDGLKIAFQLHPQRPTQFDSERFYFVHWAGRDGGEGERFLIPESNFPSIVNAFNDGRVHLFELRKQATGAKTPRAPSSYHVGVEGLPRLPAKWFKRLIASPLDAKITHVKLLDDGDARIARGYTTRIALDKGRSEGLFPGMTSKVGPMPLAGYLVVDAVEEHSAEADFAPFRDPEHERTTPLVGDLVRMAAGHRRDSAP